MLAVWPVLIILYSNLCLHLRYNTTDFQKTALCYWSQLCSYPMKRQSCHRYNWQQQFSKLTWTLTMTSSTEKQEKFMGHVNPERQLDQQTVWHWNLSYTSVQKSMFFPLKATPGKPCTKKWTCNDSWWKYVSQLYESPL